MKKKTAFRTPEGNIDVRALRGVFNLTQDQFATLVGVSTTSISRLENGHHATDAKDVRLELLARALDQHTPAEIVEVLRQHFGSTERDRVAALVHLGDDEGVRK